MGLSVSAICQRVLTSQAHAGFATLTDYNTRDMTSLLQKIRASIGHDMSGVLNFYERRPGIHQVIIPIFHEDGDMVDIYVHDSRKGEGYVRICDFGMTLMRLSYTFDVSTPARERILESVLINNGVKRGDDGLYLDAPIGIVYQSMLQFAGCVQKVCNMRYWNDDSRFRAETAG